MLERYFIEKFAAEYKKPIAGLLIRPTLDRLREFVNVDAIDRI